MSLSFKFNNSNNIDEFCLRWSQSVIDSQRPALYVCIIASITHSIFWLQFILYPTIRQKTLQWIYAYLATDILLLFRFFSTFIVHTISNGCTSSTAWYFFICYFEAAVDNYLNIIEVYILLALNLCRYAQIAHNKNVYIANMRLLILVHLVIYLIPLISFIIQFSFNWASVKEYANESCDVAFTSIYTEIFNIIFAFALPISLNILVIFLSIRHVHLTSRLQRAQHHVSAREKYHRSLIIQFLVFYTVWLSLWSPNIIAFQLKTVNTHIIIMMQLLNYIEIALDPIIIGALDARFRKVWCQIWKYLKKKWCRKLNHNQRRVEATAINIQSQIPRQIRETPM